MIKTCPICNRNFEAYVANATYCNVSCRKKAGREKEKEKRSAFYQAPEPTTGELLHSETSVTLARLTELADMLYCVVTTIQKYRFVNIYGPVPDGWVDGKCFLVDAIGSNPPCKVLGANVTVTTIVQTGTMLPQHRLDSAQRELAMKQALEQDAEVERQIMAEL